MSTFNSLETQVAADNSGGTALTNSLLVRAIRVIAMNFQSKYNTDDLVTYNDLKTIVQGGKSALPAGHILNPDKK